jgi:hypothetical protein
MLVELAVFATIAGAVASWAASECWTLRRRVGSDSGPRILWMIGALLMLAHSIAAFGVFYNWSHEAGVAATARQTHAMTGVASGAGIFVNYAFVGIWLADAAWRWFNPASYRTRPRTVSHGLRAWFVFMFLNGAIVFADGLMRILGIACVTAVAAAWYRSVSHHE